MKRLFIAAPIAFLLTLFVFGFMTWLVNLGKTPLQVTKPLLSFDILQVEQDSQAQRRQRQLPDPPKKPVQPPEMKSSSSNNVSSTPMALSHFELPQVSIDTSVSGLAISSPGPLSIGQNQQAMPLHRIEPRYPTRALSRKIEGFVVMSFTINQNGRPTDIQVLQSQPNRIFDREAKRALQRWKYQPLIVDGKATARKGQTLKLEFKLQK
ncbi:energy transducer TonB [Vibrio sp. UCD-FRSSP16_10]|uniref:energy transducer TonB n=1 Tax=unclassified Vibrio TaxID=2614977 RepID=UPI0007FCA496|nr:MULTISPECIES: energy transducer TonB [unclassified Vibrio]OBT16323.1 energy transducer TonB [Vibrio sp. UCD-FRSSP16_30]OBT21188.1 energy transducer TonB [Vibrio sp. UCD-FRSSP16_10]